ncbi:hypothetical protein PpBr36_05203 [Pyricularia pennisetigena]|uniref:hypothetical protein n=1 Tax=Pyricularia pennisetigena TaxID=1578925 RepID=UPI001154C3D2|nr:hypothetical protein PpBr36_05203 [Pyricularia pennisetigena]TLS26849.1 hypothetical protein PpBr36_05203 [Pyricularia pennisetigena]
MSASVPGFCARDVIGCKGMFHLLNADYRILGSSGWFQEDGVLLPSLGSVGSGNGNDMGEGRSPGAPTALDGWLW